MTGVLGLPVQPWLVKAVVLTETGCTLAGARAADGRSPVTVAEGTALLPQPLPQGEEMRGHGRQERLPGQGAEGAATAFSQTQRLGQSQWGKLAVRPHVLLPCRFRQKRLPLANHAPPPLLLFVWSCLRWRLRQRGLSIIRRRKCTGELWRSWALWKWFPLRLLQRKQTRGWKNAYSTMRVALREVAATAIPCEWHCHAIQQHRISRLIVNSHIAVHTTPQANVPSLRK